MPSGYFNLERKDCLGNLYDPAYGSRPVPPLISSVRLSHWPVRSSLGVFGRKWTLPIIRDLYILREARFSQLLMRNPGMSDRILSLRLRDLRRDRLVERVIERADPRRATYRLTKRGMAAVPILEGFVRFGLMQLASDIFGPGGPPKPQARPRRSGRPARGRLRRREPR